MISIKASTKPGFILPREEALLFGGRAAAVCYMKDTYEQIEGEPIENTRKRIERTLKSKHHSVYEHAYYTFLFEGFPKIMAMIFNNLGVYTTSEKSGRYTKMQPLKEEEALYEWWLPEFEKEIRAQYGDRIAAPRKLAQENARYLLSVTTPSTDMLHTISFRQLNYIAAWFERFIETQIEDTQLYRVIKKYMKEYLEAIDFLRVQELNDLAKRDHLSLFDTREIRAEEFGETYSTNYMGTWVQLAQGQRSRPLRYTMWIPEDNFEYFVPPMIRNNTEKKAKWLEDIRSRQEFYPQGMLVRINERGTYEDFALKCWERLCGQAQWEITMQTKETLEKYLKAVEGKNMGVYNQLKPFASGARCTFGWQCDNPCVWGAKEAFARLI